ncbi:MAG TPA: hypothetical protein VNU24_08320, partial [Solirubrobacteraceae bacterium]|nr:hypothetical protein [Solirubrobacteraceae bacterium]
MNAARRLGLTGFTVLCALAAVLALASAPALAKEVHEYGFTFGSTGSASGQFKITGSSGVAVNDTTHDLYVADSGNNRVEEFEPSGMLLREFDGAGAPTGTFSDPAAIAVDNSTNPLDPSAGDVYVVDSGHGVIDKFTAEGVYIGQLTGTPRNAFGLGEEGVTGVAVDVKGVLWVVQGAEPGSGFSVRVGATSFSDALDNAYISETGTTVSGSPGGLGVDSEDNLYEQVQELAKYNTSGERIDEELVPPPASQEVSGVAVDPLADEVYADNYTGVVEAFSLTGTPIETFGSGQLTRPVSIAVDTSNGTFYVVDPGANDVAVFNGFTVPTVSTTPLSEQEPTSTTLNGTVNPEGFPITSCVFQYGPTSAYGQSVPCSPASLGAGKSPVAVSAHLAGLTPGDTYHYRLVAENSAHLSSPSADQELVAGPILGSEWSSDVASSSATLQAQINPNGADTHYYFQYGSTSSYGSEGPVPAPGVDLGSFASEQTVSLHLQGLEVGMTYHYRFVAVQNGEVFTESDHSFTTQTAGEELSLPDGRTWELVSPPDKKGTLIELFENGLTQAAADGNGISYLALNAVGEGVQGDAGQPSQILSTRVPGGWRTQDISIPHAIPGNEGSPAEMFTYLGNYAQFSPNLSQAVIEPTGVLPQLSPEVSERTIYLRNDGEGSYLPLVSPADVQAGTTFGGVEGEELHFLGATPDLSHVVLSSPFPLTSESTEPGGCPVSVDNYGFCTGAEEPVNLYEWSGGQLRLVDILPNGEPLQVSYNGKFGVAFLGTQRSKMVAHAISNDGRWIVWGADSTSDVGNGGYEEHLYVRDMVGERTFQLGSSHPIFQTMSSDGSSVFYEENEELYEFDTATGTQTALTASHGVGESSGGARNAVLG